MSRAPRQLFTGWVAHPRPIRCPGMHFGRTLMKQLKRNDPSHGTIATWSANARDMPRWQLLAHSTPTPSPLTPSPPTPSPPTFNQPPASPNAPPPDNGNLAPIYEAPCLVRAPRPSAIRRNARRLPRRPVRFPRQPGQRSTSAAPSFARHRARQLKKETLNFLKYPSLFCTRMQVLRRQNLLTGSVSIGR
jgi:hypothetical protein